MIHDEWHTSEDKNHTAIMICVQLKSQCCDRFFLYSKHIHGICMHCIEWFFDWYRIYFSQNLSTHVLKIYFPFKICDFVSSSDFWVKEKNITILYTTSSYIYLYILDYPLLLSTAPFHSLSISFSWCDISSSVQGVTSRLCNISTSTTCSLGQEE